MISTLLAFSLQLLDRILDTLFALNVAEQRFTDVLAAYKRDLRNARVGLLLTETSLLAAQLVV